MNITNPRNDRERKIIMIKKGSKKEAPSKRGIRRRFADGDNEVVVGKTGEEQPE